MCKALNDIHRNARNKGKAEDRAEEIIEGGFEYGLSEESILERLQRKLNLSEGKARDYLKKYRKRLV